MNGDLRYDQTHNALCLNILINFILFYF